MSVSQAAGCVYVVATPIGNLEDFSPRAQRVMREAALIACEDTRHTAKLCTHFNIPTRRIALHAHNEASQIPFLLERLESGESIALVSDAGTPLLSDPGERLVSAAAEAGFEVIAIPGPSALLAALVTSGLPSESFAFIGFLPRKAGARREKLAALAGFGGSLVFYEAPSRVEQTLADLYAAFGPRRAALGRELTKRHEEVLRGRLGELSVPTPKGEFTLVVEGATEQAAELSDEQIDTRIDALLARELSPRDVARTLAAETDLPRSDAYRRVLARAGDSAAE